MEHYVGIDVSLELSSVCVVDGRGKIVKEAKVASEPEALVCFFSELGRNGRSSHSRRSTAPDAGQRDTLLPCKLAVRRHRKFFPLRTSFALP